MTMHLVGPYMTPPYNPKAKPSKNKRNISHRQNTISGLLRWVSPRLNPQRKRKQTEVRVPLMLHYSLPSGGNKIPTSDSYLWEWH